MITTYPLKPSLQLSVSSRHFCKTRTRCKPWKIILSYRSLKACFCSWAECQLKIREHLGLRSPNSFSMVNVFCVRFSVEYLINRSHSNPNLFSIFHPIFVVFVYFIQHDTYVVIHKLIKCIFCPTKKITNLTHFLY